ncbi:ribonuclease H2, subunit C [Lipomyces kononenkoae]|uniref:Ribonuclease H2, subunit C n=1 Tax=Lipomyces kononenkoae TaxID=34357 RepID=A0ACC3SR90_LIPKO
MTAQKCATLNIHIPVSADKPIRKVTPHILPCKIHYDGPANVRRYFQVDPYTRDASRPKVSSTTTSVTSLSTESITSIDSLDDEIEVKETLMRRQEDSSSESHSIHQAYFRGRKLVGKKLVLSEGYKGFILPEAPSLSNLPLQTTSSYLYADGDDNDDEEEDELHEQEHKWAPEAEFNELFVWDHDFVPDDTSNPWIAGINEWISFTNRIHGEYEDGNNNSELDR